MDWGRPPKAPGEDVAGSLLVPRDLNGGREGVLAEPVTLGSESFARGGSRLNRRQSSLPGPDDIVLLPSPRL